MKRTILFMALCILILSPAKALDYWSWSYWYSPVSYSEARVYFQVKWASDHEEDLLYVAGEGPLPNSDEGNTVKFPFSYLHGGPYSWVLPWRGGGKVNVLGFKMQAESPEYLYVDYVTVDEGITHIGNWWFGGLDELKEAIVPLSLQSIGEGAFKGCRSLPYFDCSDKVKSIGSRAFAYCTGLKYFKIPSNSTLGDEVFLGSAIESVDLGNNVTCGDKIFWGCKKFKQFTVPANYTLGDNIFSYSSLETVTVNDNVNFGERSFEWCADLESVTFLGRINAITDGMFFGCGSLRSVTIPNSVTKIGAYAFQQSGLPSILGPGSVKNIEDVTFADCGNLTSVKLCEGVKTIGNWAFRSCSKLETVSLPASLESIGVYVFRDCNSLKVIECNGVTPSAVNSNAFYESDITETSVCVPYGSIDAYRNAPVWKNFKNIGTYPAGIHIINGEKFTVNSSTNLKLTAKLLPHDAVPGIVWTSSNNAVASVVDGRVFASAVGEAIIIATTVNGILRMNAE
jgi:hypothetical protein